MTPRPPVTPHPPEPLTYRVLVTSLLRIKASLVESDLRPAARLIDDLGLDSFDLVALGDQLRRELGEIDLVPWLEQAVSGDATLGGLARYLATTGRAEVA